MAKAQYVVAVNGKGSLVYGGKTADGKQTVAVPLRHKEAEDLAANWPIQGQVVIYKLVAVKNVWHDSPGEVHP